MNYCQCIYEPRGDHHLEGFLLNAIYRYQMMKDSKGAYYRVYPTSYDDYYETCGPNIFKKYFKEVD